VNDHMTPEDNRRVIYNADGTYDIDDETEYENIIFINENEDFQPLPHDDTSDPRDEKIAALEASVAELQRAVKALERRIAREADFSDWQSSRNNDNGMSW